MLALDIISVFSLHLKIRFKIWSTFLDAVWIQTWRHGHETEFCIILAAYFLNTRLLDPDILCLHL